MAWCPFATKLELQPESDGQPAIRPTQFILHSLAAPWTARRTYEYWRDSTNLESHFGLGYAGDLAQYIGTQTRADATGAANRRADGTGAVSMETASNRGATDAWTPEQVEKIVRVGVWLHQEHGLPLRVCRSADDPGYGYHRMFTAWNPDAHSCPGDARARQFRTEVFPAIVARATGKESEMKLSDEVKLGSWIPQAWPKDEGLADGQIRVQTALGSTYGHARKARENTDQLLAAIEKQTAAIERLTEALQKG